MLALTPQENGALRLGKELGKGGEGIVYSVEEHGLSKIPAAHELVAKIYHEPTLENRAQKLKAMISSPVNDPAVAWPQAVIVDDQKRFLGYLMEKLDSSSYREWLYVANAKDRRRVAPAFDTRYAYAAVRNLAAAILAVHAVGHRIGDINESNIFLGADATVLIVDTDSMQVVAREGAVFPCSVGKPEFTAPELTHGSLRDTPRTRETDIFAFAVAAYQLLTGGATPHQGAFDPNSDDDPLPIVERIRKGVTPGLDPFRARTYGFTPKPGVPVNALPEFIKTHFQAFLNVNPEERNRTYNLQTLIGELDSFIPTLTQCAKESNHWYPEGSSCLWCAEASKSNMDPWAGDHISAPPQARLRPISFQDSEDSPLQSNRAAPAVAGPSAHPVTQTTGGLPPSPSAASAQQAAAALGRNPQQPSTGQPQRPHKLKGKVTVTYADGSWSVRPPLSILLRQSPKMFLWALKEETPSLLKFWWPIERNIASKLGLAFGVILSTLLALAWQPATVLALSHTPFLHLTDQLTNGLAFVPAITAALAGLLLLFSALRDRAKTRRKYGSLANFKEESIGKTAMRFVPLGLFYGLPIVLVMMVALLYLLIIFARAVARA